VGPGPDDDERIDAQALILGQAVHGTVCSLLDAVVWYTFTLQAETSIRVETTRTQNLVHQGLMSESSTVMDAQGRFVMNGGNLENGVFVGRGNLPAGTDYIQKSIGAGASQYRFTVRVAN
jgi:hypothetical protein